MRDDAWTTFFPANSPVIALPGWSNPRIFVDGSSWSSRWNGSRNFPASRFSAKLRRTALRAKAALAPQSRTFPGDGWHLTEFLAPEISGVASTTVIMGTPGPAQKMAVELRDAQQNVLAYLKFSELPAGMERIKTEASVLRSLPPGFGPKLLKAGSLGDGEAMVVEALPGKQVRASLPMPATVDRLIKSFESNETAPGATHPGLASFAGEPAVAHLLAPLHAEDWRLAIQHGDLAPWNIRESGDKAFAFDWEYGTLEGFPHLDRAFYVMQTRALISNAEPEATRTEAIADLLKRGVSEKSAEAIVDLSVWDSFQKSRADGNPDDLFIQSWRIKILKAHFPGFA